MTSKTIDRLQKELSQLRGSNDKLKNVQVDDDDMFIWNGILCPTNPPYNKGAFRIQIIFPKQYPFKPPVIRFLTKIYHPNIDEQGAVCLNIINTDVWKPATRVSNVVEALIKLIDEPEPDHPLRTDLAELFIKDRKRFLRNAEDFIRKSSEKR